MSEITRIQLATPEVLAAIAAQNRSYGVLLEMALAELERRLVTGEFRALTETRHVLWFYGRDGGMQPGTFVQRLLTAIDAADMENRRRFSLGFQTYTVLVEIMKSVPDGAERLRKMVVE